MAYEKQTWIDYPNETTPISAERLNHIEDGIADAGGSAENLRIYYSDTPSYVSDEVPIQTLKLCQLPDDPSGSTTTLNEITVPNSDTIDKLKGLITVVKNTAMDDYTLILEKDTSSSYITVWYKNGENTEVQYQLRSGNMPNVYYKINGNNSSPSWLDADLKPTSLVSPLLQYGNYSVNDDDTICYIKYQGTKVPTHLYKLYGHTDFYLAYGLASNIAIIVPIDASTHEIVTNNYIGTRYENNKYSYFPFNATYYISTSGNPTKTFTFDSLDGKPLFYKDNGSYIPYTLTSGYPFVFKYLDFDVSQLLLSAVDITLHDGTVLNYAYVFQDSDIASDGTSGSGGEYYLTEISTDKYLLILIRGTTSAYIDATILDTVNHEYSASPELYGGSGSSPYLSMTLYFSKVNTIDDSRASTKSTYSSIKIEALIANLQSQIDALNS